MRQRATLASAKVLEVCPRRLEAERSVWSTADHRSVMVVLPIIFPETDRTDFKATSSAQCPVTTAWARVALP